MDFLYHYSNNTGIFGILQSKSIRLSDVRKSNDFKEMTLFYPRIMRSLWKSYRKDPFPLEYNGEKDDRAFSELMEITEAILDDEFESGKLSNLVACFSEKADLLSQWRGYADDGRGCSIGFSRECMEAFCEKSNGVLRLEKVTYLRDDEIQELVDKSADEIILMLRDLRQWIVDNMTLDNEDPDTDGLLAFNFHGAIKGFLNNSLAYKSVGFAEESEWRLLLVDTVYKVPEWIYGQDEEMTGPTGFKETISFLRKRVEFNITMDDIKPYIPLFFSEFANNPVAELWLGPKSRISTIDIELFLAKFGYQDVSVKQSEISYI